MNKKGKVIEKTAKHFILATGERPRYPDCPGAKEYGIVGMISHLGPQLSLASGVALANKIKNEPLL